MNFVDSSIITYFNSFAQTSRYFDLLLWEISENHLLKGAVPITILWFLWFNNKKENNKITSSTAREQVTTTLFSCMISIIVGRVLALTLPFRPRPIANIGLHFVIPHGINHRLFSSLSSFPSDHATFMLSLATGIWLMSKRAGIATFLYVTVVVMLPRIYLGLHYPTDIIAGACIGVIIALILHKNKTIGNLVIKPLIIWSEKSPALFYTLFFLSMYEIASMFDDIRSLYSITYQFIQQSIT